VNSLSFVIPSYLPSILLLVALIVAGVVAYRLWSEMTEDLEPASHSEVLEELEQAYAEGEMDEAEFRRIRQLLGPGKSLQGARPADGQSKGHRDLDEPAIPES